MAGARSNAASACGCSRPFCGSSQGIVSTTRPRDCGFSAGAHAPVLSSRPFVDFHAEAIAHLLGAGCKVEEYPVVVDERRHGSSMYSALAALKYPVKNLILILLAALDTRLLPPARHDD